jgi:putative Holliday junction resolvase
MTPSRTLAIDFGTRRIGLALSDAGGKLATPLKVLQAGSNSISEIAAIIDSQGVERIVIGFPLNMDGSRGSAAEKVVAFARSLQTRTSKPIVFVDERLSSFEAEQTLVARRRGGEKLTRKSKKERLDAVAAAQFLQEFLDGKIGETDVTI